MSEWSKRDRRKEPSFQGVRCPIALEIRRRNRWRDAHGENEFFDTPTKLVCRADCVRPDRGKYEECRRPYGHVVRAER